jgi:hypothetical protein
LLAQPALQLLSAVDIDKLGLPKVAIAIRKQFNSYFIQAGWLPVRLQRESNRISYAHFFYQLFRCVIVSCGLLLGVPSSVMASTLKWGLAIR